MKLYRITRETYYCNGGDDEVQSREVLFTGFDRDEALRLYYQNKPEDKPGYPGDYGTCTRFQVLDTDSLADADVERTHMKTEAIA